MKSRLDRVKDWNAVASDARFQLQIIANSCKVSDRHLRRFIWQRFEKRPKQWLDELRAQAAAQDFERGELVKSASTAVHFAHACNFSRFYKRVKGITPSDQICQ